MNARAISVKSANLELIGIVNGRAKADVFLRMLNSTETIHSDTINPVALSNREAFLALSLIHI